MNIQANINKAISLASLLTREVKSKQSKDDKSSKVKTETKANEPIKEDLIETPASPEDIATEIYEAEKQENEIRSMVDAMHQADKSATDAALAEQERIRRSRDFARTITEGISGLSFNPNEYIPPKKGE